MELKKKFLNIYKLLNSLKSIYWIGFNLMLDSSKYKDKKIDEIHTKLTQQPLYKELFSFLGIDFENDFMQAELILEQVVIGKHYVKLIEPTVSLLDFFKEKNYSLHTIMPPFESETQNNRIIAWLIKN